MMLLAQVLIPPEGQGMWMWVTAAAVPGLVDQGVLPSTSDQWGFAALVVTSVAGGVAGVFGWLKSREARRVDALAESQAKRIEAAEQREREANERADKREEASNRRMEAALQGMTQLTHIVGEQTATMRQLGERVMSLDARLATSLEETRKANGSIEALRESLRQYRT